MFCKVHIPYDNHSVSFTLGTTLGHTMAECRIHKWTNFIFLDGKKEKVCQKCEEGRSLKECFD
jgi:hypothetical protein